MWSVALRVYDPRTTRKHFRGTKGARVGKLMCFSQWASSCWLSRVLRRFLSPFYLLSVESSSFETLQLKFSPHWGDFSTLVEWVWPLFCLPLKPLVRPTPCGFPWSFQQDSLVWWGFLQYIHHTPSQLFGLKDSSFGLAVYFTGFSAIFLPVPLLDRDELMVNPSMDCESSITLRWLSSAWIIEKTLFKEGRVSFRKTCTQTWSKFSIKSFKKFKDSLPLHKLL